MLLFRIFAARAGAELERLWMDRLLGQSNERFREFCLTKHPLLTSTKTLNRGSSVQIGPRCEFWESSPKKFPAWSDYH